MGTVVVQYIYGWERAFAVGDKQIGRNGVVTGEADLKLTGLVALALLFIENLCLKAVRRSRRRSEHTVEHFFTGSPFPGLEVTDVAISPSQRIGQIGNERVGIDRQIACVLIFLTPLRLGADATEHQQEDQVVSGRLHIVIR